MLNTPTEASASMRTAILVLLTAVLVAACGLGMDAESRLQRGQDAFDNADYRAAIIDARNVLLDDPENVAARTLLGKSSAELGDGVSAEKELRRALELGADRSGIVVELGRALLLQGKFDDVMTEITVAAASSEAVRLAVLRIRGDALIGLQQPVAARESYETVLRADGDDILAQLGVVNSFIAERNFGQARETLNQILTFDDSFVTAWLTSGSLGMLVRDTERAVNDYQRAVEIARRNSDTATEMQALSGLANAALAQRDVFRAGPALARMLEIGENDTRTLLISARLSSANENWSKAQEELQEVLRRVPDYRPAQFLLGIAHKESGNLSQGEMYLSAVVAAAPSNVDARRLLAETRLQLGEADEARQTLAPIIDDPDADLSTLSMAARASLNLGDFGDATELLERGVAVEPGNIDLQLQLAFAYFRAGDAEQARNILRDLPAAASERNEIQRDSLLILTQMAQGNLEEAQGNARALVTRWPDRAESHILAGSIELATGGNAAARKSFTAAAGLAPGNPLPIRYLAQLDELDGDPQSARTRYLKILEMSPEDVQTMVSLAKLAAVAELYEESRDWLEKARSADPGALTPRRILAALHLAFRDFAAAEAVAEESLDLDQDDAYLYNLLGQAQFNRDDFRGAEVSFERAIELNREQPSFRLNLAQAQTKRGNMVSAIATLSEPPGQYLEHLPSAVLLASLKASSGAADEAAQIAAELKRLHPDSASPYALEAELLARGGDLAAAAKLYDQAMGMQISDRYAIRAYQIRSAAGLSDPVGPLLAYLGERPLDNNVRAVLAQGYQGMGEFGESSAEYERVLQADPDNFVVLNNLAWNYMESGDARAEATARRAYEIEPDNSSVIDTLGWILVRKGTPDDGVPMLRRAVEKSGDRPEIRFHLAAGLVATGEAEDAKVILTEILAAEDAFGSRQEAEDLLSTL